MFRSFIYLNEEKMYSYLRQIDKEFANQPTEVSKRKTREGTIGNGLLGVNAGTETEEKRELVKDITKDYDRFEKKLDELDGTEYFDLVLKDYDINTVPNMSIIRVNGSFEIPEQFDMFNLAQNFMPLLKSQIKTSSQNEKELMETFLENASADIPIVMENEDLIIASKLSTTFLEEEYTQLEEYSEQGVYMLCKVVGKMLKNQVEIFNPLKDFVKLPRAVRRSMDSNSKEVEPIIIDGSVLKVEVIAIYK
ncbi:MAG: hypothetical protein K1W35_12405 [Lachnospiraceae bacterium]